MARGALHVLLLLAALMAPARVALATSSVELKHAADGTLLVVGEGWRSGQPLVLTLGQERYLAYVDSAGAFEVVTGLTSSQGPLVVHHPQSGDLAMLALEPTPPPPSPLAVALVQGFVDGLRTVAGLGAVAVLLLAAIRPIRNRRYPPR